MSHLHAVTTTTREDKINALVRHMLDNPDAIRTVAAEVIDGTETLRAAGAEIVRLHVEWHKAETRAESAEAAHANTEADYDRRGERLWRLAAKAGYTPCESDNDATAEMAVADALAAHAALVTGVEALAAEWRERFEKWGDDCAHHLSLEALLAAHPAEAEESSR